MQPLLTISIPCYRRPDYLRLLLASIFDQIPLSAYDHQLQILIADDSPEKCNYSVYKEFITLLPSLRYVAHSVNLGIDANIDYCLRNVESVFVIAVGEDDLFIHDTLAPLLRFLESAGSRPDFIFLPYIKFCSKRRISVPPLIPTEQISNQKFTDTLISKVGFIGSCLFRVASLPGYDYLDHKTYFNHVGLVLSALSQRDATFGIYPGYIILNRVGLLDAFSWGSSAINVYKGYREILELYSVDSRCDRPKLIVVNAAAQVAKEFSLYSIRSLVLLHMSRATYNELFLAEKPSLSQYFLSIIIFSIPHPMLTLLVAISYPAYRLLRLIY